MNNDDGAQAFLTMLRRKPTTADCNLCRRQLDAYVQAQLDNADYRERFSWLSLHLDSCPSCAEAYGLLYDVAWAEANGRLPQPRALPQPNLDFLRPSADWLPALKEALRQTPERLTLRLNKTLLTLLAPTPTPTLTTVRAAGRYQTKLVELTPDEARAADLPLTLTIYADQQQPDLCLVEITVQPPDQSWPELGGRPVTIAVGETTTTAETDAWGTVVFTDIAIDDLATLTVTAAI